MTTLTPPKRASRRRYRGGIRSSRRRDTPPPLRTLLIGLGVTAALAVLGWQALEAPNGLPFVSYRTLYASVPDPGNLQPHAEVAIAGVQVGQVIGIRASHGRAVIHMKLGSGTRALPANTTVLIRADGLLGQRYVELVPGNSAKTLANGATVSGRANSLTYGVPDALDTFDKQTRGAFGDTLNSLGVGVLNRGSELNQALGIAPVTAKNFQADSAAVLQVPGAAKRLVPALDSAASALDFARANLVQSFQPIRETLQPLVDHSTALSETLDQAPVTLAHAQVDLGASERLLTAARSLAAASRRTLPAAPGALASTTVLLNTSHEPLARAQTLLADAIPTVPAALKVTGALQPNLTPLRQTLALADPIVTTLGAHGCDVYNMTSNWRSALGYGDTGSGPGAALPSGDIGPLNFFRVAIITGTSALQGTTQPGSALGNVDVYPVACKYAPGSTYIDPAPSLGGN